MNESQKRVVKAMQKFFENFRKKHCGADAGNSGGGKQENPQKSNRRLKNGINTRATTEI